MSQLWQITVKTLTTSCWNFEKSCITNMALSCTGICNVAFVLIWHQQQRRPLQYRWQLAHLHMPGSHWSSLNISEGRIDLQSRQWPDLGLWTLNMLSCTVVSETGLTYCQSSLLIQKALCFQQCAGNYLVPVLCGCPQAPAWCLAKFWCVEAPAGWR